MKMMPYPELFIWWAASISGGSIFLTLVSIYLYTASRSKRKEDKTKTSHTLRIGKRFVFIWVLLSLLVFYIVSISIGSTLIFALGNIIVEALLLVYLLKNKTKSE
jgi:uncharacterized membrane protein YbhN (UPF0104 family)